MFLPSGEWLRLTSPEGPNRVGAFPLTLGWKPNSSEFYTPSPESFTTYFLICTHISEQTNLPCFVAYMYYESNLISDAEPWTD